MAGFDPSVLSTIADNAPNPMGAKQDALTLAGMSDKQQLGRLQLKQAEDSEREKEAVKGILSNEKVDYSSPEGVARTAEKISKVSPDYGMKFIKQAQEYQTGEIQHKIAQMELADKQNDVVITTLDPIMRQLDDMQGKFTPAQVNQTAKALIGPAVQSLVEAHPEMKPMADKWMQNPLYQSYQGLKSFEGSTKQGQARLKEILSEHKQQDSERKTDIAQQRADAYQKDVDSRDRAREKKESDRAAGIMAPEDVSFRVGQYLAGDKSATTGLGSLRSDAGMKNWAAFNKDLRIQATAAAKELGLPEKDAPKYVAGKIAEFEGYKSEERARGTRQAAIEIAGTEFTNMSKVALDKSKAVPRTQWVPFNELEQKYEKYKSNKPLAELYAATNSAINIYARAINPTGVATDDAKKHAREMLYTAQSQDVYDGVIATLNQEIDAAKASPDQVKADIMASITGHKIKGKDEGKSAPNSGEIVKGYRFKGGNPADKNNWEKM